MSQSIDVLIIGSGPAGASTALHLVRQAPAWAGRILVVDKAVHPREKLCGGGVTHIGQNILARLGLPFEPQNFPVREVRLVYEDKSYSFYGNPVFRIVRRDEFDHWLVKTCEQMGVTVRQGEAVKQIVKHDDYVEVVTDKATFQAQVVVAADGSRSFVRRALKWDDESRVARLLEVLTPENGKTQPEFRDGVAVFDFTRMTDGLQGYYWDFPSYVGGRPFMNRGLFDSRARPERPKADLKRHLRESLAQRARNLDDVQLKGHPIRWWDKTAVLPSRASSWSATRPGPTPCSARASPSPWAMAGWPRRPSSTPSGARDFSFATYRQRLLADPLFAQLHLRVRLARLVYRLRSPWLVRLGWRVAGWGIKFTRWRDPSYVPTETPPMNISTNVSR